MNIKLIGLVKCCFFAVGTSLLLPLSSPGEPDVPHSRTITPMGIAVLKTATQVQTFRVRGTRATVDSIPGKTLDGYTIVQKGALQGKTFTQTLVKAIAVAFTYSGPQDRCRLSPAVAYQFHGKSETIDVFLCFRCGDMAVIERDASGKIINDTGTKFTGAPYKNFVRSAQSSFPDDVELKALK